MKRKYAANTPRPDYIINNAAPSSDDGTSWLIGDFVLSGNSLYKKYVNPGYRRNQFDAITNHARKHGIRISLYISFFSGDSDTLNLLQAELVKESFKKGELLFLIYFKQNKDFDLPVKT